MRHKEAKFLCLPRIQNIVLELRKYEGKGSCPRGVIRYESYTSSHDNLGTMRHGRTLLFHDQYQRPHHTLSL